VKTGVSWSLGCGADYALTGLTAVTSGLFIDKTPYKIVYKKTASERNDLEINTDFVYLTIPAGLRLYVDLFMLGGGLYMGYTLSCKSSLKYGNSTTSVNLENPAAMGLFIDTGMNFTNLMLFFRFKSDLTCAYKREYIVTNIRTVSLNLSVAYRLKTFNL